MLRAMAGGLMILLVLIVLIIVISIRALIHIPQLLWTTHMVLLMILMMIIMLLRMLTTFRLPSTKPLLPPFPYRLRLRIEAVTFEPQGWNEKFVWSRDTGGILGVDFAV